MPRKVPRLEQLNDESLRLDRIFRILSGVNELLPCDQRDFAALAGLVAAGEQGVTTQNVAHFFGKKYSLESIELFAAAYGLLARDWERLNQGQLSLLRSSIFSSLRLYQSGEYLVLLNLCAKPLSVGPGLQHNCAETLFRLSGEIELETEFEPGTRLLVELVGSMMMTVFPDQRHSLHLSEGCTWISVNRTPTRETTKTLRSEGHLFGFHSIGVPKWYKKIEKDDQR